MATKSNSTFSVIGTDIAIKGDIKASADLHVDGNIEGDLTCASLVQGETSTITGGIKAESARLSGAVNGSITARELVILRSARIKGDVFYDALTIEQGAEVEGRFAHRDTRESRAGSTSGQSASQASAPPVASSGGKPELTVAG